MPVQQDEYGEVLNRLETYEGIALYLKTIQSAVVIGWTDELGSHFDILFTLKALGWGGLQGGVKQHDLFISIMRRGAFGFEVKNLADGQHPNYIGEKLNMGTGVTTEKLAELLQGVAKEIIKQEK